MLRRRHRGIADLLLLLLCPALVSLVQYLSGGGGVGIAGSGNSARAGEIVSIALAELLRATDDFSERAELGRGGFGVVFGTHSRLPGLQREGRCAVKRLHASTAETRKGLHKEVTLLGKCRHENLLPLLGVCLDRRALCLVYPLLTGGNLDDRLHRSAEALQRLALLQPRPRGELPPAPSTVGPLGWRERLRIVRDAMRALVYLHTPSRGKGVVLHRDVKPTNILLDEQLNAKLADVELATESPELSSGRTHVSSRSLVGTAGYIDPLYANSGQYSQHTDGFAMGAHACPA